MNFNKLKEDLKSFPSTRIVFVGLGNPLRGDDAAGLIVTEHIQHSAAFQNAQFIFAHSTPENHLQEILDYRPRLVVIIDAADWGGAPGEFSWITCDEIANLAIGTHSYSISLIEKYLKLNSCLEVKYLVIQPDSLDFSQTVSSQFENRVKQFFN